MRGFNDLFKKNVLAIHVLSVILSSVRRCHFVICVNIYATHFYKFKSILM